MRIISKYKDYYDHMQGMDQDKQTVFVRNTKEERVKLPEIPFYINDTGCSSTAGYIFGFAGKLYRKYIDYRPTTKVYWLYGDYPIKKEKKFRWDFKDSADNAKRWLNADHYDLFEKFGHIFVIVGHIHKFGAVNDNEYDVISYPRLEDYGFQHVLNPYQAYQELTMWIYNSCGAVKTIPEMPNEVKIESHGFNKFSFRKDKSS